MALNWPAEMVATQRSPASWHHAGSNRILDFHGDPVKAQLVVFSDGNHHMALHDAIEAFYRKNQAVGDIFYATTPPYPLLKILHSGAICVGNLIFSMRPHVIISPAMVLDRLRTEGFIDRHVPLARNRGSVLLIARNNPKEIKSVADLMRPDVRLFLSNPQTEKVSYKAYRQALERVAERLGLGADAFCGAVFGDTAVWGERIHHREAPEALAGGTADAAIVYHHLALRYTRIFPDLFDYIPLDDGDRPHEPEKENNTASIHMGVVGDGGKWGAKFIAFMQGEQAAGIYTTHGLVHCGGRTAARSESV